MPGFAPSQWGLVEQRSVAVWSPDALEGGCAGVVARACVSSLTDILFSAFHQARAIAIGRVAGIEEWNERNICS